MRKSQLTVSTLAASICSRASTNRVNNRSKLDVARKELINHQTDKADQVRTILNSIADKFPSFIDKSTAKSNTPLSEYIHLSQEELHTPEYEQVCQVYQLVDPNDLRTSSYRPNLTEYSKSIIQSLHNTESFRNTIRSDGQRPTSQHKISSFKEVLTIDIEAPKDSRILTPLAKSVVPLRCRQSKDSTRDRNSAQNIPTCLQALHPPPSSAK